MTDERLAEIWQFIRKYGSGNGWTGTLGLACTMIHELLKEREATSQAPSHPVR